MREKLPQPYKMEWSSLNCRQSKTVFLALYTAVEETGLL
ncbi:hypothetical protein S7335_1876 [Synechococcus sp. PCC 7335]|nr:hypothetical protein S7335_1876 [Synechococcus sp. PCC 7335]